MVSVEKKDAKTYGLLGDNVVGGHGLGVGGLLHGHGGRIPGGLLGGLRLVGRLEPAEHGEGCDEGEVKERAEGKLEDKGSE